MSILFIFNGNLKKNILELNTQNSTDHKGVRNILSLKAVNDEHPF
jgi:hypothetical protein